MKYLKEDGRPQTLVRTGGGASEVSTTTEDRNLRDLDKYWNNYHEGTVFASLNSTAFNTVMVGYTI